MLSAYFAKKINSKKFSDDLLWSIGEIKNKKVLLYGAGEGFNAIIDKFPFAELNIVAIADMKFKEESSWRGYKAIPPKDIKNQEYDLIMITNEYAMPIIEYITDDLGIVDKEIRTIFNEQVMDEMNSILYLEKFNFGKQLPKLYKKMQGKSIVIYGAGIFFEAIATFYDLSKLNIIAISDRKYSQDNSEKEFLGYKTVAPDKINDLKPDYVLVATKFYINIIEDLETQIKKPTRIKPLLRKNFFTLLKEIWK